MKYKFIDNITSDVMFEAYGKTNKELFENAALALFSVICEIKKVKPKIEKELTIKSNNLSSLMFSWLQELIALSEIELMFFSKIKIIELNNKSLKAKLYGEEIKPNLGGTVVKAVTNYKYKLEKNKVTVSLDI